LFVSAEVKTDGFFFLYYVLCTYYTKPQMSSCEKPNSLDRSGGS